MAYNEVSNNIETLIKNLNKEYIYPAMANACAIVRNDAQQNAPDKTGALRRSIDFDVAEDGSKGVIYSNLEYAPYVEVGTGIYATLGEGRQTPWVYKDETGFHTTEGMVAQPFLEPALQQNTTKIQECFEGMFG